jgi:hypothetical protein
VGNPWNGGGYPVQTHGWIFPQKGKTAEFAAAWNGLIYPVTRVGAVADLHKDWMPDSKMANARDRDSGGSSEAVSVSLNSDNALKVALLLRLAACRT